LTTPRRCTQRASLVDECSLRTRPRVDPLRQPRLKCIKCFERPPRHPAAVFFVLVAVPITELDRHRFVPCAVVVVPDDEPALGILSATAFAPLNWASGHHAAGRPQINREAYYTTTQPAVISPAAGGAANWAAKAYSPNTKLVYMPVSGFSSRTYVAIPFDVPAGRSIQDNGTPRGGRMPQAAASPLTPPYIGPPQTLRGGYLVAFDPGTRTERWRVEGGGDSGGGALVTASNLVFQVVNDGRLRALAAEDGKVLWEAQTGQTGMGPPITYQLDGKQHVSFMGGTGQLGGGGAGLRPMVYTFVLDGKTTMPSTSAR
jgi:quinohemoprotein ethanol dehydrogenase